MSGTVITVGGSLFNNSVTDAKLRDSIALSIIGRPVNTDGDPSDIQATVDGDVLRLSGTTLGFGSIPESSVTGLVADLSSIAASLAARPTGSGTANTIPKWTGVSALGNSSLTDDGTTFAVNTNKFTVVEASGNTSIAGTLGVTGDFAVATNKFTVAAASGNTLVAGTLSSTGDFAVATNKFTVAASSGNTLVAGTLTVSTMTAASVPFIGTAGLLSQDNTNFTWDNTNKQLIVISPSQVALWVKSNNQPSSVVYVQNTNATGAADLNFVDSTTANRIGIGYANASYGEASRISKGYIWRNGVNFSFVRPTNILDATIFTNGNWNIGSTATDPGVKLRVEGTGTITGNTIIGTNGSNRHTSNGGLDCINAIGTTMASLDSLSASPLAVWDSTAQATGVGGGILFLGKYLNSGGYAGAGGIKLFKENGTDNNYSFGLGFGTRANGGNLTQWLRLTSAGEAVFGDTLSAPTKSGFSTSFEVARTSASARFLLSSYGTSIQSTMYLYRGRGTAASTTVIQSTDGIGSLAFTGATGSGSSDFFEGARIAATATENWSLSSNFGTKLEFTTTTNAAGSGGRAVRLTIDHDGTVGIGVAAVSGQQLTVQSVSNSVVFKTTAVDSNSLIKLQNDAQNWQLGARGATSDAFIIRDESAGVDRMRFDIGSTRYVGLGNMNVAPIAHLDIYETNAGQTTAALTDAGSRAGLIFVQDGGTATNTGGGIVFGNGTTHGLNVLGYAAIKGLIQSGAGNGIGDLAISTRNATADTALTERIRILTTGNVGIGTSAPDAKLTVKKGASGTSTWTTPTLEVEHSSDCTINLRGPTATDKAIYFTNPTALADGGIVYDNPSFARGMQFRTGGNTTRMQISSAGAVTINEDTTIGSGITKNHTINGKVVQSVQANAHGIDITQSQTGQTTTSKAGVNILVSGSYDTTAGNITAYAIKAAITATESAGGNILQNICASFSASGSADQNIALATLSGDVVLNSASGTTTINGATTIAAQLDMNSHKIVNVTDPTSAQDAATKAYVDGSVSVGGVGRVIGYQKLTASSGTYTPTSGTKRVLLKMVGGGGGGGSRYQLNNTNVAGGGAAGSYLEKWIDPSATITGGAFAAGAAGAAGNNSTGGTGGDTTVVIQGTTYTAKGGTGGTAAVWNTGGGASGGVWQGGSSAGDYNTQSDGFWGWGLQTDGGGHFIFVGGAGGSSPLGHGGGEQQTGGSTRLTGTAANGYGGGGGGAVDSVATGGIVVLGGVGTQGVIIIIEFA